MPHPQEVLLWPPNIANQLLFISSPYFNVIFMYQDLKLALFVIHYCFSCCSLTISISHGTQPLWPWLFLVVQGITQTGSKFPCLPSSCLRLHDPSPIRFSIAMQFFFLWPHKMLTKVLCITSRRKIYKLMYNVSHKDEVVMEVNFMMDWVTDYVSLGYWLKTMNRAPN